MIININMKQIGKRKHRVAPIPLEYKSDINTIEQLITETVLIMLNQYRARLDAGKSGDAFIPTSVYSEEQLDALAEIGRISFGMLYNDKLPDEKKAVETALQAFEDGLVRIFLNDEEVGGECTEIRDIDPDKPKLRQTERIDLTEGDTITFIRMTFLAGRMY